MKKLTCTLNAFCIAVILFHAIPTQSMERLIKGLKNKYKQNELTEKKLESKLLKCKSPQETYDLIENIIDNFTAYETTLTNLLKRQITQGKINKEHVFDTLFLACIKTNDKYFNIILAAAENLLLHPIDNQGNTLLHQICFYGHVNKTQSLINITSQYSPFYICTQNNNGITPLMNALYGQLEIFQLITQAANKQLWNLLSAKDKNGSTVLMLAAERNYVVILQDLITAAGKNAFEYLNMQDNNGNTALDYALLSHPLFLPNLSAIALLKEHGGLTGKEIQRIILLLHADDHLGDLSILPRDVRKYLVQYIYALSNK